MSIERTFSISTDKDRLNGVDIELTYYASYHDHSFDHEFGREVQGGYEIDSWELVVSKFTLGWKTVTIDCLEVPEPLYAVIEALVEKHLAANPPEVAYGTD